MSDKEKEILKEIKSYINDDSIDNDIVLSEDLSSSETREIRKLIRMEIAEIFFDLFKKRSVWV